MNWGFLGLLLYFGVLFGGIALVVLFALGVIP